MSASRSGQAAAELPTTPAVQGPQPPSLPAPKRTHTEYPKITFHTAEESAVLRFGFKSRTKPIVPFPLPGLSTFLPLLPFWPKKGLWKSWPPPAHERGQLAFQRGHWVQLLVAPQEAAGGPGAASPAGSALQVPTGARICLWQGWAAPLIGPTSSHRGKLNI